MPSVKKSPNFYRPGSWIITKSSKLPFPPGHLEMLKISGLGPKKIHALHKELGISTVANWSMPAMKIAWRN